MSKTKSLYWLACISYFLLVVTLGNWFYTSLPTIKSPYIMGTILALLLFSPIMGMLKAKPYTFAWAAMLALLYFTHGIIEIYANKIMFNFALSELITSSVFFTCAGLYARMRSREIKKQHE